MAKKQKKSKKNDGKKAAEAKNLAEAASKSAVVDDMEPLEATAANDAAALEAETATEAAATPVNPVDLEDASPLGDTYHRGPVILRGQMIPSDNTTANLLKPDQDTDWLHMDHGVCCASNRNSWTVSGRSPSSDLRSLFSAPHAPAHRIDLQGSTAHG
mgnify:FL=1